ncbi:DUF262 domain-containing protein [Fusobacterium nucleatum]
MMLEKEMEKEIEIEDREEVIIDNPFNPQDIKISVSSITLDNLVKRLQHGEIDLNPDFQRNSELWNHSKMSRLIESIILRLPLPVFYFDVSNNSKWVVIDGLQRLCTIQNFIVNKSFKLRNLEFLKYLNGKKYDDLDRGIQRTIEETQFITYQMEPQTPKEVRYSIFNRINTGGLILNPQEIRQALNQNHQGVLLLKRIANNSIFKEIVRINSKRMIDRELILRFFAFKLYSYEKFSKTGITLAKLLDTTMEKIDTIEFERDEFPNLEKKFLSTIKFLGNIFSQEELFNKKIVNIEKKGTINRSLFEIWVVLISELSIQEQEKILEKKDVLREKYKKLLLNPEFDDSVTKGTQDRKAVITRFNFLRGLLEGILNDN